MQMIRTQFVVKYIACAVVIAILLTGCAATPEGPILLDSTVAVGTEKYITDRRPSDETHSRRISKRRSNIYLYGDEFFIPPPIQSLDAALERELEGKLLPERIKITRFEIRRVERVYDRNSPALGLALSSVGLETGKRHYSCRVTGQIGGEVFAVILSHPAESQNQPAALSDVVKICISETVDKIKEEI